MMKKKRKVYIFSKSDLNTQSGDQQVWYLQFSQDTNDQYTEPVMGWTGSNNSQKQIKMLFKSKELAVQYANENQFDIEEINTCQNKKTPIAKTYTKNFKQDKL